MIIPHGSLVMVIDGSRMQLFRNGGTEATPALELIASEQCRNPATHMLGADKPGRSFSSSAPVRHSYAEDDLHERREQEFAAASLEALSSRATSDAQVVLIAPPRMLGYLRKITPKALQRQVVASFDKDFVQASPDKICRFLRDQRL